jgi:hypothetical protein
MFCLSFDNIVIFMTIAHAHFYQYLDQYQNNGEVAIGPASETEARGLKSPPRC